MKERKLLNTEESVIIDLSRKDKTGSLDSTTTTTEKKPKLSFSGLRNLDLPIVHLILILLLILRDHTVRTMKMILIPITLALLDDRVVRHWKVTKQRVTIKNLEVLFNKKILRK